MPAIEETLEVLKIVPDRIGHGTCLDEESGGSKELVDLVLKHKIPLGKTPDERLFGYTVKPAHVFTSIKDHLSEAAMFSGSMNQNTVKMNLY